MNEMNDQNRRSADVCAVLCLVFSIIAFPAIITVVWAVALIVASAVCGIVAFAMKTKKTKFAVVGLVLDVVCIVVGIVVVRIALPILIALLYAFSKNPPGQIRDANLSPTGIYQIDEVNESYGATGGVTYLAIERTENGEPFGLVNEDCPDGAVRIGESDASWDTDYDITWVSDTEFYAYLNRYSNGRLDLVRVELDDEGYSANRGHISVDEEGSYFDSFEIVDDVVYITCYLKLANDFDEAVSFTINAKSYVDDGGLLAEPDLKVPDPDGNEAVFSLEAGESRLVEVVFVGVHGPEDTKADRLIPRRIELDAVPYDLVP